MSEGCRTIRRTTKQERKNMTNELKDAMREAVEMAGGRMSQSDYLQAVFDIREADGADPQMDSVRTHAMKPSRMAAAGICKVQIGQNKMVWSQEYADSMQNGTPMANDAPTITVADLIQTKDNETNEVVAGDVFYGVPVANPEDYPANVRALIPTKPTGYVEQNGEMAKAMFAFKHGLHQMTEGPTGCGKTMFFKEKAYQLQRPLFRINCKDGITWEDMVGYMTVVSDGNGGQTTQFVDGQLTLAIKYGGDFYVDEINFARPSVLGGLNMVLDSGMLDIPMTGEVLRAHPDFRIVASMNPNYAGTNRMNQATRRRFGLNMAFDYLPAELEATVIQAQTGVVNEELATTLVAFANDLRRMNKNSEFAESTDVGTATLVNVMTLISGFSITEALDMGLLPLFDEDDRETVKLAARSRLSNYDN